jgi:hypothetical protein
VFAATAPKQQDFHWQNCVISVRSALPPVAPLRARAGAPARGCRHALGLACALAVLLYGVGRCPVGPAGRKVLGERGC